MNVSIENIRNDVVGIDEKVPTLSGEKQYINFDNAASTPTFGYIRDKVNAILKWYSNVERGTGFKSQISTWAFEESREIIQDFVNADPKHDVVIFTKNTTEALNHLAHTYLCTKENPVIITSMMEHHSNDLPWRDCAELIRVDILPDGSIDLEDLQRKLNQYKDRLELVTITGAANVTGFINPIHRIAKLTHNVGAKLAVDAAQLAPHRPIDMKPFDDPEHIDYLAFAGHKMYAPYGVGVLVGNRETFDKALPDCVGGGTVKKVTLDDVVWADAPERLEAGTPTVVGCVAVAASAKLLQKIGWEKIIQHEKKLTEHALKRMSEIPEVTIYGGKNWDALDNRLGVITFNVDGVSHKLVASILNYEGAIGVRNGLFCAHPYTLKLLGVAAGNVEETGGCTSRKTGAVRASFGIYNTCEEIDEFCDMLQIIADMEYDGDYKLDTKTGAFIPRNFEINFKEYFDF